MKRIKGEKRTRWISFFYAITIAVIGVVFILQSGNLEADAGKVKFNSANNNVVRTTNNVVTNKTVTEELKKVIEKESVYSYDLISKSESPKLYFGDKAFLTLKIKNTGSVAWYSNGNNPVSLGTSRANDRVSIFYQKGAKGWQKDNRVSMDKNTVKPGDTVSFVFEIKVPDKVGIYREFFTPVVDGIKWMDDKGIYWDVQVNNSNREIEPLKITVDGKPEKYIKISLNQQLLYVYDNGLAKYIFQTSTGRPGMDTPKGVFAIQNKFPVQYSPEYELYMDNWMAFTPSGAYGMHSLPYWQLRNGGRLYEGEAHLGVKVSHGCVRTSLENSKLLYNWAEVGTPVFIED